MDTGIRESADLSDELHSLEGVIPVSDGSEDVPLDEPSLEIRLEVPSEESDGGCASKQSKTNSVDNFPSKTDFQEKPNPSVNVISPESENIQLSDESSSGEPTRPNKPPPIVIQESSEGFQSQPVGSPESQMTWMQTMGGAGRMFTGEGDTEGSIPRQPSVSNFFKEEVTKGTDAEGKNFFDSFMTYDYTLTSYPNSAMESHTDPSHSSDSPLKVDSSSFQELEQSSISLEDNKDDLSVVLEDCSIQIDLTSPEKKKVVSNPSSQDVVPIIPEIKEPKSEPSSPKAISEQLTTNVFPNSPTAQMPFLPKSSGDQEDIFTAAISSGDSDRRHDAWIPSEKTKQILISRLTSPQGSEFIDKNKLTMPGVSKDLFLKDPVLELVVRYMGESEGAKRCTLTADQVSNDETGLKMLLDKGCLRASVDLTARLLTNYGQGIGQAGMPSKQTPQSLQVWLTRISLLMKLRQHSVAETESKLFGDFDNPDLYFEFYPDLYSGRKGSMVPFSLRVLIAELPQYSGKHQESMDKLYQIKYICKKILSNLEEGLAEDGSPVQLPEDSQKASIELWKSRDLRMLYSIGNCLLAMKDFNKAASIFESLLERGDENDEDLLSGIGRIHLQLGDLKSAQRIFQELENRCAKREKQSSKMKVLMNKALLHLSQHMYVDAFKLFTEVVEMDPENHTAVNNLSVCQLYMGKLRESLSTLESLVHSNPDRFLDEGLLFNLCTLYELESSRSMHKKQALLGLVNGHRGDEFNVACLKMT